MYSVYIIKNLSGKIYIGITNNIQKRLNYHNTNRGALFTKTEDKFFIVFSENYTSLAGARTREIQIKKWRRDKKEIIIKRFSLGLPTKLKHAES